MTSLEVTVDTVAHHGIDAITNGSIYESYSYAYPHKTAYRPFPEPQPVSRVWAEESAESLFLYLHIPFCEHRCGFCNLFTQANPEDGLTARYLRQLAIEADTVVEQLAETHPQLEFSRVAIGGGTPTFLTVDELQRLFNVVMKTMGADAASAPISIEVSPATVDREKLALLSEYGVERISIGVQSFDEEEVHQLGRPQGGDDVEAALSLIRASPVPRLNIDLIYGGAGQTVDSWVTSIDRALRYSPEEIYLYPLYVRPLTGLGRRDWNWDDHRLALYRAGRETLLNAGYMQQSMRMFVRSGLPESSGPEYCCQSDGMVGIGCGARSYTTALHYSTEYAVQRSGVRGIIGDYLSRDASQFQSAHYGIELSSDEQRRRFVIQSLLQVSGLDRAAYVTRFGNDVFHDFHELTDLETVGMAHVTKRSLALTPCGMERSDAIGPWMYSPSVRQRMNGYELK